MFMVNLFESLITFRNNLCQGFDDLIVKDIAFQDVESHVGRNASHAVKYVTWYDKSRLKPRNSSCLHFAF